MHYFRFFFIIFSVILSMSQLFATVYEDAEDKKSSRWELLDASSFGKVENIYDKNRAGRIIKLKGEGTKSAYKLMMDEGAIQENQAEKILHWEMNYREDFVIIVGMDTKGGKRYLIYTPSDEDGYMQYGLGEHTRSGTWQTFNRNLQEDLNQFEELNDIKRVHTFVVRGSGSIDNVSMLKKPFVEQKKTMKSALKTIKEVNKKKKTDRMPSIQILGENPMHLRKGETFIDPGATAYDKEDGELPLISSTDVDIHQDGKYSVMYIATNSTGNTAVDTRYVEIGESAYSEKYSGEATEVEEDQLVLAQEEDYEDELKLEERKLEMTKWEKELEVREKEMSKRESRMQNFSQFQTGQF